MTSETNATDRFDTGDTAPTLRNFARFLMIAGIFAGCVTVIGPPDSVLLRQLTRLALGAIFIVFSIRQILEPKTESWLDPVLDAAQIAFDARKIRLQSIALLMAWTAFVAITLFDMFLGE